MGAAVHQTPVHPQVRNPLNLFPMLGKKINSDSFENQFREQLQAPVGGRLSQYWQVWEKEGAHPSIVQKLKEGLTLKWKSDPPLLANFPMINSLSSNPERMNLMNEHVTKMLDKKAIVEVKNLNSPGFYSRLFMIPKKGREMASSNRPIQAEQISGCSSLPNGNSGTHSILFAEAGMGHVDRFKRCIFPCPDKKIISKVSSVSSERKGVSIRRPTVRTSECASRIHSNSKRIKKASTNQRLQSKSIFGRLGRSECLRTKSADILPSSSGTNYHSGISSKFREIVSNSNSKFRFCRLPLQSEKCKGNPNGLESVKNSKQMHGNVEQRKDIRKKPHVSDMTC